MIRSIRSYLGYVETIEMISRRLSKTQKAEIVEAYRAGDNINSLAGKYSCTTNTINRTVKTLLSDSEYLLLKENRSKSKNKKEKLAKNIIIEEKNDSIQHSSTLISLKEEEKDENLSINVNEAFYSPDFNQITSSNADNPNAFEDDPTSKDQNNKNEDLEKDNQSFDNNFELIAPLISGFDFEKDKQKQDFEILNFESLPESVYMIVDKKVELELQPIADLPEWSFLPKNELERNAILLFANQRSAKRSCTRNQRVIKIPNTKIFRISKSYLISKGITRLILEDSIIALDN